jgi:hypothetical protein
MKRVSFCGTRQRGHIALAGAAAFLVFAGTANAQVLAPGATIQFGGQFTEPTPVLLPGNSVTGCPSQAVNLGLVNCKYFSFTAGATGTVTFTFDAEDGANFVDASVHCNDEVDARAIASSNAGDPMTVTFDVVQGDFCEIRVSIFLAEPGEALPTNPLTFTGSLTLTAAGGVPGGVGAPPPVQKFKVTGGGRVNNGSFTSNANSGTLQGLVRYFAPNGCKSWSTELTSALVEKTSDGGIATITGKAKVSQNGTTTTGVDFEARAEDHGESGGGVDRFHTNLCGGVDMLIDNGNIQIHPVQ